MSQRLWGGLKNDDVEILKKFAKAIDNDDYQQAIKIANSVKDKSNFDDVMFDIALWDKYSQSNINANSISFNDISRFVNDNQFFPNLGDLRKNAEKVAVVNRVPYEFTKQYFNNFPATTPESKVYLLGSEIDYLKTPSISDAGNVQKDIQNSITSIWINENFSAQDETKFLEKYGDQLTAEDHIKRIDSLLWDGNINDAKRIFYLVNDDYKSLFSAIIEIADKPKYIENIIASVPRSLRDSELLAYRVIMWQKARIGKDTKDRDVDNLVDMLEKIPANVDRADKWWSLKNFYSREMIKRREYKSAYRLAANNGLKTDSSDYIDSQWLAGWIALRFLDEPKIAYGHFNNVYNNVSYPISISRAAYWLGMSAQVVGNKQQAISWYKVAAKYPTYFYGQLAIHKHRLLDSAGSAGDIILPKDPDILYSDIEAIKREKSVKIAYILALMGNQKTATKVLEYSVVNAKTDGQIAVIMKVVNEMKNKELDVKVSKFAAKRNVFFIKDKFQIIKEVESDQYAPLVHAIIKQESGFATLALSSVGAIGFMQLMPQTAQSVCKQIGIRYSKHKLANDINYNIILGSFYIKSLIDQFNGSEMMAIAAYNAGPSSVQRWVREFYDPRQTDDLDKVVDWIELITYSETRNYVQRIMENLIVYKYLMSRVNYDAVK